MLLRKDLVDQMSELVKEAKKLFPDCPEIYQAIRDDNGTKVIELLNKKIGTGYSPTPVRIIKLLNADRTDIIRKEAQSTIDQQAFYSKCIKVYHLP